MRDFLETVGEVTLIVCYVAVIPYHLAQLCYAALCLMSAS